MAATRKRYKQLTYEQREMSPQYLPSGDHSI